MPTGRHARGPTGFPYADTPIRPYADAVPHTPIRFPLPMRLIAAAVSSGRIDAIVPSGLRTTLHVLSERRPDVRIRGAEQGNRRGSDRSGEVCHSGIVSDENRAPVQRLAQIREILIQEDSEIPDPATRAEFAHHFVVRFAADQKKIAKDTFEPLNEFDPTIDRPVLLGRTAAHVKT